MTADAFSESWAKFSPCRTFRYQLGRAWAPRGRAVCFIMLNPSTADETHLDPTVRRCIGYAMDWGFSALWVGNLFALRATDPRELYRTPRIGDDWRNDAALVDLVTRADLVVAAWGNHGGYLERGPRVLDMLRGALRYRQVHYLKITGAGHPAHPLYLRRDLKPTPYIRVDHFDPDRAPPIPPGMVRNLAPCGECSHYRTAADPWNCVRREMIVWPYTHAIAPAGRPCFTPKPSTTGKTP